MSEAGWAERKVERKLGGQYISLSPKLTAELLRAEHRRAVRVVEREIANLEVMKSSSFCNAEIAKAYASITVLRDILALLQRGRE